MPDIHHHLQAVEGYLTLGLYQDAWDELDSLPPDIRVLHAVVEIRCEIYQRMERWNSARVLAESMARRFPENPTWWIFWAYSLRRETSVEAARGVLWEAVQIHPGFALITYNLACYASVLGELDEARRLLSRAFSMDPDLRKTAANDEDLTTIFQNGEII